MPLALISLPLPSPAPSPFPFPLPPLPHICSLPSHWMSLMGVISSSERGGLADLWPEGEEQRTLSGMTTSRCLGAVGAEPCHCPWACGSHRASVRVRDPSSPCACFPLGARESPGSVPHPSHQAARWGGSFPSPTCSTWQARCRPGAEAQGHAGAWGVVRAFLSTAVPHAARRWRMTLRSSPTRKGVPQTLESVVCAVDVSVREGPRLHGHVQGRP